MVVIKEVITVGKRDFSHKSMITACWLYCCIVINWLIIMILFVIMFMLVVSLQVHSMY